jgi:ornithine--oxo-acid transaminase
MEIDPARATARAVCEELLRNSILSKETHDTVVRFAPPLIITKEELDWAFERIKDVFETMERINSAA